MTRNKVSTPLPEGRRETRLSFGIFLLMDGPTPMATTTTKQRLVSQIFSQLASKCKADEAPVRPVLEEFVYAILREGHTRDAADQAFDNLKKNFFDWNEIRVSMTEEIVGVIGQWTTDAERRAQRIVDFLQ